MGEKVSKKNTIFVGVGLGVIALLLGIFGTQTVLHVVVPQVKNASKTAVPSVKTATKEPASQPTVPTLHVAAAGDMLAHDSIVSQASAVGGYDFTSYFKQTANLYDGADIRFCNPETAAAGKSLGVSGYPTFNAPEEFARDLAKKPGCNLINLATNHINDKGQAGIDATIDNWLSQKPLAIAGANKSAEDQKKVAYFTKNGIKVAFIAFADFSNTKNYTPYALNFYHDTALVTQLIGEARKNADVVIVSAHWGTEDSTVVNADQQAAAQLFADLGADVVIGTGPHVLQKTAVIAGKDRSTLVWYSIGNMLSSQLQVDELTGGVARFDITKEKGKITVKNPAFYPTFMSYEWSASDKAAQNLSARRNLTLLPLKDADGQIHAMFPSESSASRLQFVKTTLGETVNVK